MAKKPVDIDKIAVAIDVDDPDPDLLEDENDSVRCITRLMQAGILSRIRKFCDSELQREDATVTALVAALTSMFGGALADIGARALHGAGPRTLELGATMKESVRHRMGNAFIVNLVRAYGFKELEPLIDAPETLNESIRAEDVDPDEERGGHA